jgi:hypothetical protein
MDIINIEKFFDKILGVEQILGTSFGDTKYLKDCILQIVNKYKKFSVGDKVCLSHNFEHLKKDPRKAPGWAHLLQDLYTGAPGTVAKVTLPGYSQTEFGYWVRLTCKDPQPTIYLKESDLVDTYEDFAL